MSRNIFIGNITAVHKDMNTRAFSSPLFVIGKKGINLNIYVYYLVIENWLNNL